MTSTRQDIVGDFSGQDRDYRIAFTLGDSRIDAIGESRIEGWGSVVSI